MFTTVTSWCFDSCTFTTTWSKPVWAIRQMNDYRRAHFSPLVWAGTLRFVISPVCLQHRMHCILKTADGNGFVTFLFCYSLPSKVPMVLFKVSSGGMFVYVAMDRVVSYTVEIVLWMGYFWNFRWHELVYFGYQN